VGTPDTWYLHGFPANAVRFYCVAGWMHVQTVNKCIESEVQRCSGAEVGIAGRSKGIRPRSPAHRHLTFRLLGACNLLSILDSPPIPAYGGAVVIGLDHRSRLIDARRRMTPHNSPAPYLSCSNLADTSTEGVDELLGPGSVAFTRH
jgi:hypothetical protein